MTAGLARLAVLTAVNAVLVFGVFRLLAMPVDVTPTLPDRGSAILPGAAGEPGALDLSGLERNQVLARPLFAPDRQPWQPPAEPEVVELAAETEIFDAPEAAPELTLIGIAIADGRASALLLDPMQGTPEWVAKDDTLAGWTVREVSGQSVTLEADGQSISLSLYPTESAE